MIRVIKHGNKKQNTCKECGCIFAYEASDVTSQQVGMNEYDYFINCPDCGETLDVAYMKKE